MKKLLVLSLLSVLSLSGLSEVCARGGTPTTPAADPAATFQKQWEPTIAVSQEQWEPTIAVVKAPGCDWEKVSLDTLKRGSFYCISLYCLNKTDSEAALTAILGNGTAQNLAGLYIEYCGIDDSSIPLAAKVVKSCDWLQCFYFSEREGLNISSGKVLDLYDALKELHRLEKVKIKVRNESPAVYKELSALATAQGTAMDDWQKYCEAELKFKSETGDKVDAEYEVRKRWLIYDWSVENARWLEAKVGKAIAADRNELPLQ